MSAKRSVCTSKNGARWKPVGTPYSRRSRAASRDELLDAVVGRARQPVVGLDPRAHRGARGVGSRNVATNASSASYQSWLPGIA